MNQDKIIEMARQAGFEDSRNWTLTSMPWLCKSLEVFAKLVADSVYENEDMFAEAYAGGYAAGVVAEREACAKLCDEYQDIPATEPRHCAQDIRARGET